MTSRARADAPLDQGAGTDPRTSASEGAAAGVPSTLRAFPVLAERLALRQVGDDLRYLMDSRSGEYFELEPSQLAALRLADGTHTVASIAAEIGVAPAEVALFFELQSEGGLVLLAPAALPVARPVHLRRSAPPHLSDVLIEVTGRCNLACAHCFNAAFNRDEALGRELSLAQLLRLVGELDELNVRRIQLSGGEPLLRDDLFEIIGAIDRHRIFLDVISTNAVAVTEALAARLAARFSDHGALYISMDGVTPGAYDAIRGEGVFARFEPAIRLLDAGGCRIFINTMATRANLGQMDALFDWMAAHPSVRGWRIGMPKVLGRYAEHHERLEVEFERVIRVFARMLHRWMNERPPFRLELSDFFRTDSLEAGLEDHRADDHPCKYALGNLTIKPDGTAVFCASLEIHEPAVLGNVAREGLAPVWYGARHADFRGLRIDDLAECRGCRYVRLCGGGCRSNALLSYGELRARDPRACVAMQLLETEIVPSLPPDFAARVTALVDPRVPFTPPSGYRRFI
jgi:radical SAM protein with 4Fe4S-binding SPASM domain